ncbi:GTP pyrophosphokinase family protein [Paenibacillus sp. N1-5-1-14]|uniref:GTP pyrophosphokinase n=1 Tax=Paenibacillus radicibacter TaxID=2972488 RepID=UPI002158EEA5|nr:GTP pyrophosphokinase family protein [Paenibacillus radicibacter]MCR8643907.1 GTP pyrophosphokinase family protein [Paenibacillus radicibacter]
MDGRDWKRFLFPYEQAVEELKIKFKTLRTELKRREEYAPIEFVTGRVKKISSILEKAKRLDVEMDDLETGIEDIAGIRIMCQFGEDIMLIAAMIRERQDMKVIYEKDYITHKKESGYRSFHVIVEYPVQTSLGMKRVLAELQIRTLAMNFWATIEHSLSYKYKGSVLPEDVRIRLSRAAEAAYILDQEMSNIRDEIVTAQIAFEDDSSVVTKVLNDIQELFYYHRVREAVQFQLRFNELWGNDEGEMRKLSKEVEAAMVKAKSANRVQ